LGLLSNFTMRQERRTVKITTDYITLGQLLKLAQIIQNGGQAKSYLSENEVIVNGEIDCRRGRKLRSGDLVEFAGMAIEITQ
jgi:ribosome-associated protein